MQRRRRQLMGFALAALGGVAVLLAATAWVLWTQSLQAEEEAVADLAQELGQRTERIVTGARDTLAGLNELAATPCSDPHLRAMDRAAFSKPHVVAVGYWEGARRQCGVGFSPAVELKPPSADRIYDSGVIAWWPSPHTEVAGVELFLMRYGQHDIAIDPRLLLNTIPVRNRRIGLWVEGLRMASIPRDADLPQPGSIPHGLTVSDAGDQLRSHYRLGTIVPIDVVVTEPVGWLWARQQRTLTVAGIIALILAGAWVYAVVRYSRHRLSLATELREAIAGGRIEALYQPLVDTDTGRCVGAEALARWTRDNGEAVSPDAFIPLAERAGLVPEVTLSVLRATLRDIGDLLRNSPDLQIHLNLSARDLESDDFTRAMAQLIAASAVPASRIKLEITERSLVNSDTARAQIDELRDRGHEIAIDDFGTGYSSLSYLETFRLDTLKIDKSFVEAIGTEAVTSNVIGHVIEMARSLRLETVAEGVETSAQAEWLRGRGVRLVQGFLYSRPLTARRFRAFLHTRRGATVYPFRRGAGSAAS